MRFLIIAFVILIAESAHSATKTLIPFKQGKLYGYVDSEGNIIVPPQYERTFPFREGLGRFKIKNKYGFLNTNGRVVISAIYSEAWDFQDGLAKIKEGFRFSFLNKAGQTAFVVVGEDVSSFQEGMAIFKKQNLYGFINSKGAEVYPAVFNRVEPFENGFARVTISNKQGLAKPDGSYALLPIYSFIGRPDNNRVRVKNGSKWEIYDCAGVRIKTIKYQIVSDFSNGRALVKVVDNARIEWRGYINTEGEMVVKPNLIWGAAFNENLAVVKYEGLFGVINPAGEFSVKPQFDETNGRYSQGLLGARKGDKWGFIDSRGNWIIQAKYFSVQDFYRGIAMVATAPNRWGAVNLKGKLMIPTDFDLIYPEKDYIVAIKAGFNTYYSFDGKKLWEDKPEQ